MTIDDNSKPPAWLVFDDKSYDVTRFLKVGKFVFLKALTALPNIPVP